MGLDLQTIRGALATQLRAFVSSQVNVYDGYIPDSPTPPAIIVGPDPDTYITYHESFSQTGLAAVHFRLTVITPPGPGVDGQIALDSFLSAGTGTTNSVLDALDADRTFAGTVSAHVVTRVEALGRIALSELLDQQVQGDAAAIFLDVHTTRT